MDHEDILRIERELSEIRERQAAADEQHRTIFKRLDKQDELIASVQSLAGSVERLALNQKNIDEKVDELCTDVDEIKAKPGKRWEALAADVLKIVVAAVVGYILAQVGLG